MPEPQPFSVNLPAASIEFPFDTTRAVASLLFSGTFVRYSNVRFVFAHAGGTIPLLSARLARLEFQARFRDAVPGGVLASLKALYFDTALSVDPYTAAALLRFASPSRIVFGSDFPHAGTQIVDTALSDLRAAVPDLDVLEAIEHINARALLDKRSG
ncbi:amidohydrolase family protein [Bradyrhizobium japonicum]